MNNEVFNKVNESGNVESKFQQLFDFHTTDLVVQFARQQGVIWQDMDAYVQNIYDFSKIVREIESQNNPKAVNIPLPGRKKSTARGVYQFTKESVETAFNRVKNMDKKYNLGVGSLIRDIPEDPIEWTPEEADLMFISNILSAPGSDEYMHAVGSGEPAAGLYTYYNYHYQAKDKIPEQTKRRAEAYFKEHWYFKNKGK